MNKKTLISSLLITLTFLFLNVQKVSAAINYNLFNYTYPVSAYYPKSSDKANVMGRIIKINNVRNDYSVSIPMDVSQNSEGKLNYFGLTTSTNAYLHMILETQSLMQVLSLVQILWLAPDFKILSNYQFPVAR